MPDAKKPRKVKFTAGECAVLAECARTAIEATDAEARKPGVSSVVAASLATRIVYLTALAAKCDAAAKVAEAKAKP